MTMPTVPSEPPNPDTARRQRLSSLADADWAGLEGGAGTVDGVGAALSGWRQDVAAREAWHTYHLIGDVMRSEDLAQTAARDQDFLSRLRTRLDDEPSHLLPAAASGLVTPPAMAAPCSPAVRLPQRVGRWQASAALAASVAVVAVGLLVSKTEPPSSVQFPAVAAGEAAGTVAGAPVAVVNTAGVLRDPRLDEFLRLHHMARGGLPMGAPGGSLQRADLQMPAEASR